MFAPGRYAFPTRLFLRTGLLCSALVWILGGCGSDNPERGEWVPLGVLEGDEEFGAFGTAVSINADGTVLAIGAQQPDNAGMIRTYALEDGAWVQSGADINGEGGILLGASLSLNTSGDTLAAGLQGKNFDTGAVRVYRSEGTSWVQVGPEIDGQTESERFGSAVALSADGKTVAVGIPGRSQGGAVETYQLEGGAWTMLGTAISGEATDDWFGTSIAINASGDTILVGATGNDSNGDESGHAQVFKFESGAWSQVGGNLLGDEANDELGRAVSMSADGTKIILGAPGSDTKGFLSGLGRILSLEGNTWTIASDLSESSDDRIGRAVSMAASGDDVIVGGEQVTRVYGKEGDSWQQRGSDIESSDFFENFGGSVALSADGDTIVITAQNYDSSSSFGVGRVVTLQWSK